MSEADAIVVFGSESVAPLRNSSMEVGGGGGEPAGGGDVGSEFGPSFKLASTCWNDQSVIPNVAESLMFFNWSPRLPMVIVRSSTPT